MVSGSYGLCVPELYGLPEFVRHSARARQAARVAFPRTRTAHEAQDEEPRFLEHFRGKRSERFVYLANVHERSGIACSVACSVTVAFHALWQCNVVSTLAHTINYSVPLSPIPAAGTGGSAKGCC